MSGHYVSRVANFYLCLYFWQLSVGLVCQQKHLRPIKINRTVRLIFRQILHKWEGRNGYAVPPSFTWSNFQLWVGIA